MLPAAARMKRRQDFQLAVRKGGRAGGSLLTSYLFNQDDVAAPARVGLVVGRGVGGAVVRNRVRRRLRAVARPRAAGLPAGSLLVIRAHPGAADARQRDLAAELDLALDRLTRRQVRAAHRP